MNLLNVFKKIGCLGLLALLGQFAALAQPARPQQSPAVISGAHESGGSRAELHRQSFEKVWRTVNDKHFDPQFGGVDWNAVRAKYEPKLSSISSDQEFYKLLQQMLGELRQSHFNIIPPESIIPDEAREPAHGGVGIDLRLIKGEALITSVASGSAADRAGIRPGFILTSIGGKSVEQVIAAIPKRDESEAKRLLRLTRSIMAEVNGAPGSRVSIVCLDAADKRIESALVREKLAGELSPPLGNFPPQYTEFEAKKLEGNIGYIRFNIFTLPIMEKVRYALRDFYDANGLIFDLRGNPGGVGGMASGIAGLLMTKGGSLGTMKMRTTQLNLAFFPQAKVYTGPVAILIDGLSASTSELFASGLQELGRAVVAGDRSLGAALPSYFEKLPTGALFQYAIADFKSPKGTLIEGRGVIPDLEVKMDRSSLLSGRDPQLDAALKSFKNKTRAVN